MIIDYVIDKILFIINDRLYNNKSFLKTFNQFQNNFFNSDLVQLTLYQLKKSFIIITKTI